MWLFRLDTDLTRVAGVQNMTPRWDVARNLKVNDLGGHDLCSLQTTYLTHNGWQIFIFMFWTLSLSLSKTSNYSNVVDECSKMLHFRLHNEIIKWSSLLILALKIVIKYFTVLHDFCYFYTYGNNPKRELHLELNKWSDGISVATFFVCKLLPGIYTNCTLHECLCLVGKR